MMKYILPFIAVLFVAVLAFGLPDSESNFNDIKLIDAGMNDSGSLFFTTAQSISENTELLITKSSVSGYEEQMVYSNEGVQTAQVNRLFVEGNHRRTESFDAAGKIVQVIIVTSTGEIVTLFKKGDSFSIKD